MVVNSSLYALRGIKGRFSRKSRITALILVRIIVIDRVDMKPIGWLYLFPDVLNIFDEIIVGVKSI